MICKFLSQAARIGAVAFLLFVLLFADSTWGISSGLLAFIFRGVVLLLRDPDAHWVVYLCFGTYFTAFTFYHFRRIPDFWRAETNPNLWLTSVLFISSVHYIIDKSSFTNALTLLGGAVLGQGVAAWRNFEANDRKSKTGISFEIMVISLLVVLLALASVRKVDFPYFYTYEIKCVGQDLGTTRTSLDCKWP